MKEDSYNAQIINGAFLREKFCKKQAALNTHPDRANRKTALAERVYCTQ